MISNVFFPSETGVAVILSSQDLVDAMLRRQYSLSLSLPPSLPPLSLFIVHLNGVERVMERSEEEKKCR